MSQINGKKYMYPKKNLLSTFPPPPCSYGYLDNAPEIVANIICETVMSHACSVTPLVTVDRMLAKGNIKVVVYSGQLDLIVDTLGQFLS